MYQPLQDVVLWMNQFLNATSNFISYPIQTQLNEFQPPSFSPNTTTLHDFGVNCSRFAPEINISGVKLHFTQYVPGGTNLSFPENHFTCGISYHVVSSDICRVAMAVPTSESSEISLEAWFPLNYSGRFLSTANRGLSGCIVYNELEYATSLGFAAIGANNGHNGTSGSAFFNNPNAIADYAYRSVHTGVVVGKELAKQFYGFPFSKSYFLGCSSGGRQGFKAAQDFPEDFDGIIAGAPALALTRVISWGGALYKATGDPASENFVTPELWAAVYDEVLRQCDALDGAIDGLLEDPGMCQFTPETLICSRGQTSDCLTGKQAETVRSIFSPFYGLDGELLYPRMQPGINTKKQVPFYFQGVPWDLTEDWFKYVVYNDTTWDGRNFSVADAMISASQNPFNVDTWKGDLSTFANNGGKLLTYHGLQDFVVSPDISQLYYAHVSRTMNMPPRELDNFYRLFYVSGMDHCRDGDGASAIGQDVGSSAGRDPNDNALMAMVRWVEEGIPPKVLRGAKLSADGSQVEYWRAHCKWPLKNRYIGPGSITDERAWQCL
ncbi:ferulic acid esterase [Lentinula aciculospora]|uniref:Carboxylic ester hydrolase n=1 Tax=Lentinula aciculospora TaxID=153920 RepID=A0A9W9AJ00_9AGAR|nr:ferulic acid esterase [Lentinula aciculospora]